MKIRVRVAGYQQLGRLAQRLREAADGGLRRELATGLQRAAPPVVAAVQRRVLTAEFPAIPSSTNPRRRSTGLRTRLAAATRAEPLTNPVGVRLTVDGDVVMPGEGRRGHKIALYSDGHARDRWRHNVFGRTENSKDWFNQKPDPWFAIEINVNEIRFSRAAEQAMDRTARRILR